MKNNCLGALLFVMAGFSAGTAKAAVFDVSLPIGTSLVSGKIITDGTLGVLRYNNIVSWNLVLKEGVNSFYMSSNSGGLTLFGNALVATQKSLSFSFSRGDFNDSYFIFNEKSTSFEASAPRYSGCSSCFVGFRSFFSSQGRFSRVDDGSHRTIAVAASAVPEPATWGLMVAGFGVLGYTIRRRPSVRRMQLI